MAQKRPSVRNKVQKSSGTKTLKVPKVNFEVPAMNPKTRKKVIIGSIATVVIVLGIVIGIITFFASTSAKMSISDEAKQALTKQQEGQAFYMLSTIDIDQEKDQVADIYYLTRIDPKDKQFIVISIPSDTYVPATTGGGTTLKKISQSGKDEDLIKAVSSFAEAGIAHYQKIDAEGLTKAIDQLGGIDVDLKEQTDDPKVGKTYIPAGESKLNGQTTLTLLRSKNYIGGDSTVAQNQRQVARGLIKALYNNNTNMAFLLDQLAGSFQTDMSTGQYLEFIKHYEGVDDNQILDTSVPGYRTTRNNEMVFIIDAGNWKNIKQQVSYGALPGSEKKKTLNDVNPGSFSIIIQNGSGVDGSAAMLTDKLKGMGCKVEKSENADNNNYEETLIIYKNKDQKSNAEAIKGSIDNGRVVNGEGVYDMKSDVLIIIGKDFKI